MAEISGDMFITCATIAQSYLLLITSSMIGISGGTQAILSYNYGARRADRVKDAERNILGVMLIFTTIMFLLSRLVPGTLFCYLHQIHNISVSLSGQSILIL